MRKEYSIWIVSAVSLIASIAALFVSIFRSRPMQVEWASFLVGALSLLVTVLVGWNIYCLVDIKGTRKEIKAIASSTSFVINNNMAISEHNLLMIYHYLLLHKDPLGLEFRFLYHGIACIVNASQNGDITTCNMVTKAMLQCLTNPQNISFISNSKNDILKLVSSVKRPDEIEGFLELVRRIALIGKKDS